MSKQRDTSLSSHLWLPSAGSPGPLLRGSDAIHVRMWYTDWYCFDMDSVHVFTLNTISNGCGMFNCSCICSIAVSLHFAADVLVSFCIFEHTSNCCRADKPRWSPATWGRMWWSPLRTTQHSRWDKKTYMDQWKQSKEAWRPLDPLLVFFQATTAGSCVVLAFKVWATQRKNEQVLADAFRSSPAGLAVVSPWLVMPHSVFVMVSY